MAVFFGSSALIARLIIGLIWSITPLSWLCLTMHVVPLVDARFQLLPSSLIEWLPQFPAHGFAMLFRITLVVYCGLEAAFSIYHTYLIHQAQKLLGPYNHSQDFLRHVMQRAVGTGMGTVYTSTVGHKVNAFDQAFGASRSFDMSEHMTAVRPRLSSTKLSHLSPPMSPIQPPHSVFTTPAPSRPISPSVFAPLDWPLSYEDPRAADFREIQTLWFRGCKWEEVRKDNLREWLAWALYGMELAHVCDSDKRAREEGRLEDLKRPLIEETLLMMENRAGASLEEGYNPDLRDRTIRLSLDPVRVSSRPLALYLFTSVTSWMVKRGALNNGYRSIRVKRKGGMQYLVRIPPGWDVSMAASKGARPLVFTHGLGLGLVQYAPTIKYLATSPLAQARPIIIPLQPSISMDLLHPSHLRPPSKAEMTEDLLWAINEMGFTDCGIDLLGHSNGTILAAWILKALPQVVKRVCLVDPVCFCLWEPHVCHNFLYAEPKSGIEHLMRYFVGTEIGVALTLQRHFEWADNILYPTEVPGFADPRRTAVFLAGNDGILNASRVRRYLLENGMKDADTRVFNEEAGVEETIEGDGGGKGGLVVAWNAAHGESLSMGNAQFDRVVNWLEGKGLGPAAATDEKKKE